MASHPVPCPGVRSTFFKSLSVATELAELEGCRPSLHCEPPQKGPGRPWSCHIPETGAWAYPTLFGPPNVISWFITPSKYGYNYHRPKREIVVMFTNWTLSTGGPTFFQRSESWISAQPVPEGGMKKLATNGRGKIGTWLKLNPPMLWPITVLLQQSPK